jgi:hypothetical protein
VVEEPGVFEAKNLVLAIIVEMETKWGLCSDVGWGRV